MGNVFGQKTLKITVEFFTYFK